MLQEEMMLELNSIFAERLRFMAFMVSLDEPKSLSPSDKKNHVT